MDSTDNKDEQEQNEDQVQNEEQVTFEEPEEIEEESEDLNETENIKVVKTGITFSKTLLAAIIDVAASAVISVIVLYLADIIMRSAAGLYISDKKSMFIIIFIVVSILYTSIMEATKKNTTFGKQFCRLKVEIVNNTDVNDEPETADENTVIDVNDTADVSDNADESEENNK